MSERIDPQISIGAVALTVANIQRSIAFYRDAIGLRVREDEVQDSGQVRPRGSTRVARLHAGGPDLLELHEIPGARRARHATGLYHYAILLPTRADLARAILRLSSAGARIHGASDHGVSEAIYLADPDGNGIEIYRDRPREEWPRERGEIRMPTDPLDLEGIMGEAPTGAAAGPASDGTRIGHVHLHVADLAAAEHFYVNVLGFDVVTRYGAEALFVSAGGYHHHIGLNTWAGVGAPAPPENSAGLRWFELRHTSEGERDKTVARAAAVGVEPERVGDDYLIRDPSRSGIRLAGPSAAL